MVAKFVGKVLGENDWWVLFLERMRGRKGLRLQPDWRREEGIDLYLLAKHTHIIITDYIIPTQQRFNVRCAYLKCHIQGVANGGGPVLPPGSKVLL